MPSATIVNTYSRHSNSAALPLPSIPRRSSAGPVVASANSSDHTYRASPQGPLSRSSSSSGLLSDLSTSPFSSASSRIILRPKRSRGVRSQGLCPPEQSTPTPSSATAAHSLYFAGHFTPQRQSGDVSSDDETPRPRASRSSSWLKRHATTPPPRLDFPPMAQTSGPKSAPRLSLRQITASKSTPAPLLCKKSGEPLKSSLKSSKPKERGNLSVLTGVPPSKSEPTTPTKAVHFDAHLEHVKLFLAEQKPLAVSRDGSPTEDTSGTDTDFPPFIFGESSRATDLSMQLQNMAPLISLTTDVALEKLVFSAESMSIVGTARVRNIAYEKWVGARFTFDVWQTTSEVVAKYTGSIDAAFDRFLFTIRVADMAPRIQSKTLILALKYCVAGRELWDNNGGRNYVATFSRHPVSRRASEVSSLQRRLEQVARKRDALGPAMLAQLTRRMHIEDEDDDNVDVSDEEPPTLCSASLSSRYSWKSAARTRTQSHPCITQIPTAGKAPWTEPRVNSRPPLTSESFVAPTPAPSDLGSPRDIFEEPWQRPTVTRPDENGISSTPLPPQPQQARPQQRRHHQRGYFDNSFDAAHVRRTPPASPNVYSHDGLTPLSSPSYTSSPTDEESFKGLPGVSLSPKKLESASKGLGINTATQMFGVARESSIESDLSTPSMVSSSASSSRSPSPSPVEGPSLNGQLSPETLHRQLISHFCFYTDNLSVSPTVPRVQSTSTLDDLLSASMSRGTPRTFSDPDTSRMCVEFGDVGTVLSEVSAALQRPTSAGSSSSTPCLSPSGCTTPRMPDVCPTVSVA